MPPFIPFVSESVIVNGSIDRVWEAVQLINFPKWFFMGITAEKLDLPNADSDIIRWSWKDIDLQIELQIMAIDYINHSFNYSCIMTSTPSKYTATGSSIKCTPVTCGRLAGQTLVEYNGEYSTDVGLDGIEYGKKLRTDTLENLASWFESQDKT